MGTEAMWIPAAVAALGAGVQGYAAYDAGRKTDEAAAQGIRVQAGHQREADARVGQEITSLQNSSPEASQRQATDAFMEQLRRTRAQAQGEHQVGATSDAYNSDTAQAATDIDKYGANRAGVLGRINAPAMQRTNENVSRLHAGTDLGLIANRAQGDQFLAQLRQQNIRANPWLVAGGQVLSGVGSGMAGNVGGSVPVPKGGIKRYDAPVSGFTRAVA